MSRCLLSVEDNQIFNYLIDKSNSLLKNCPSHQYLRNVCKCKLFSSSCFTFTTDNNMAKKKKLDHRKYIQQKVSRFKFDILVYISQFKFLVNCL